MTLSLCDFCGGEMHAGRRAKLTIHDKESAPDTDNPFSSFFWKSASSGVSMEMCHDCLRHLLPISERLREQAAAKRRAAQTSKDVVEQTELLRKLVKSNAFYREFLG